MQPGTVESWCISMLQPYNAAVRFANLFYDEECLYMQIVL